jgi:hypothetical protein
MKELEERIAVSKAARRHHLDARTLKRWLQIDAGYDFSEGGRLALVADIEAVIIRRTAKGDASLRRTRRLAGAVIGDEPRRGTGFGG